jgi:TRAP-type C4-dicarboxylate transport system permease small subunit
MLRSLSRALDALYRAAAYLSGALLVLLCGLILWSVLARLIGVYAGGATDVAGYVMATSTFLALAYTFRSGGHIRVQLLVRRLAGGTRRAAELLALGLMSAVAVFLAWYMTRLAHDSWAFGERSQGADAILIWIPQAPVAAGAWLLALAVLHTLAQAVLDYDAVDPDRGEAGAPEP